MNKIKAKAAVKKYGEDVELTPENIKDIYLLSDCNRVIFCEYIDDYITKNYSEDTILKWNDEYINNYLDKIEELMCFDGLDTIRNICRYFSKVLATFTKEKETYKRIINLLMKLFKKFGYFMNYWFFDVDPDDRIFGEFRNFYVGSSWPQDIELEKRSTSSHYHYIKNTRYCGILPILYFLGYNDLFEYFIKNIMYPIFEHYQENSKYLEENGLEYFRSGNFNLEEYHVKRLFDKFIAEYKIEIK